jgi:hypothetical protein
LPQIEDVENKEIDYVDVGMKRWQKVFHFLLSPGRGKMGKNG